MVGHRVTGGMAMLIRLENGDHVDPARVTSVEANDRWVGLCGEAPPQAIVRWLNGDQKRTSAMTCESYEEAKAVVDAIAARVNAALAPAGSGA